MSEQREKTIDVLRRLKAQESMPKPKLESFSTVQKPVKREEPVQIINIPQRNMENLIHKLDEIDRKMKSGSNSYFNLYYDLKNAEQTFLREVEKVKRGNFQIPETTMKRMNERISLIEKKNSMGVKK